MIQKLILLVTVTEEDIRKGCREADGNNCAIARALKRGLKNIMCFEPRMLFVGISGIEVFGKAGQHGERAFILRGTTPAVAGGFIHRFDRGEDVKPFSFRLTLTNDIAA